MQTTKSRTGLWIALVVILAVLMLAGGGAYFYFTRPASTPQKTLDTYCDALRVKDFQTAYKQLSKRVQAETSESAFSQSNGFVLYCTFDTITQTSATTATATIRYALSKGGSAQANTSLVYEDGAWKIDDNIVTNQ